MGARRKVLVVDDDELVLTVVGALLDKHGIDSAFHDSGFGLASAVRSEKPDVIVLDLGMPGLAGDVATQGLRELAKRWEVAIGPIVVYSALPPLELEERAGAIGARSAVSKSRGPLALILEVKRLLSIQTLGDAR